MYRTNIIIMNIYKLKYASKEEGIEHLTLEGLYEVFEGEVGYSKGVHAIVEVGRIVDKQGTYSEEGEELTPTTFLDGYHFDIMTENTYDFWDREIKKVKNPKHSFAGVNIKNTENYEKNI